MKQIKCYCGHTTYCYCVPLQKETRLMKTKEEIEQSAKEVISGKDIPAIDMRIGFKLGYTQCQEDMKTL